jgi:lysozyme
MNINTLREEIEADEGCEYKIYRCSEGYPTAGIGHLITEWDEDYYDKPIGTPVPEEKVQEWFVNDVQTAINDCNDIFNSFEKLPEDIQHVLINMAFQLGGPRLRKFKMMIAAVEMEDYREMALQMEDSRWFKQTTNRAQRLIDRVVKHGVPI